MVPFAFYVSHGQSKISRSLFSLGKMAIICVIEIRDSFFSHDMRNFLWDYDSVLYNVSE